MAIQQQIREFQKTVWDYSAAHGRDLPWRHAEADGSFDPYKIMVSEIMLQQTQVSRVIPKFNAFLLRFPDVQSLAEAPLADVLMQWVGLGYNRRAKFLWQAAQRIVQDFGGEFPKSLEELMSLPGIGRNTAGAILAYALNKPVVFIETNIRTVFIHHFFADKTDVSDKQILNLVEQTLPRAEKRKEQFRIWYWALMDYGTFLKSTAGAKLAQSKHYVRQSAFEGSKRQIRGKVIRLLSEGKHTLAELEQLTNDARLAEVLKELVREEMINVHKNTYALTK